MYIDVEAVFAELENGRKNNTLRQNITKSAYKYQGSLQEGCIEQIDEHGVVSVGVFENGQFQPIQKLGQDID